MRRHGDRDECVAQHRCSRDLLVEAGMGLEESCEAVACRGRIGRPLDGAGDLGAVGDRLLHSGSVARRPGRILVRCPGFASPPPRSTRSWATSRETPRGSWPPTRRPRQHGADLVVFPELTVTGYPPEDLLLRPAFVAAAAEALEKVGSSHRAGGGGRRVPRGRPGPVELGGGPRARPGAGRVPQAAAPQLRGLRRAPLLRAGHRRTARSSW